MGANLRVDRVRTEADRRAFLSFPYRLYRSDPNWIPRLWPEQMSWLRRQHDFFELGDAEWYIARRKHEVVGTIGVAVDHHWNKHLLRKWGVFGFLEFVQEPAIFAALAEQALTWLQARGMTHMMGPQSFGPNDFPGFLVRRFDLLASLFQGYSLPYYVQFAEQAGWQKYQDSIAYRFICPRDSSGASLLPPSLERIAARVGQNPRYSVRQAEKRCFEREAHHILRLYNRGLGTLPRFAPLTEGEFRTFAEDLMPVLDEEMTLFALADGQEVGFALAIPNLAEAFHKSGGLRYPWNYAQLWWSSRHLKSVSFKILVMDPDYWTRGIEVLMYQRLAEVVKRRGYEWVDFSLTGDDNPQTNKIAAHYGLEEYKRYRTFQVEV